jgi:small basic protein (TIGR04137 family)
VARSCSTREYDMSIHRSLVVKSQLSRARNVWTRLERITKLEEEGKYEGDESIFGLPKVRTVFKVKAAKKAATGADKEEAKEADKA